MQCFGPHRLCGFCASVCRKRAVAAASAGSALVGDGKVKSTSTGGATTAMTNFDRENAKDGADCMSLASGLKIEFDKKSNYWFSQVKMHLSTAGDVERLLRGGRCHGVVEMANVPPDPIYYCRNESQGKHEAHPPVGGRRGQNHRPERCVPPRILGCHRPGRDRSGHRHRLFTQIILYKLHCLKCPKENHNQVLWEDHRYQLLCLDYQFDDV